VVVRNIEDKISSSLAQEKPQTLKVAQKMREILEIE